MFTRWQTGVEQSMALTPDTLDDVRKLLEASQDVRKRPIISAIRSLSNELLAALSLLCSSSGAATLDEIWFASNLSIRNNNFSYQTLQDNLNLLISKGLIEILPNQDIKFNGDIFDLVYTKVWIRTRPNLAPIGSTLGIRRFRNMLTERLEQLILEIIPDSVEVMETCCSGLREQRILHVCQLINGRKYPAEFPPAGEYVYVAAFSADLPEYLTITTEIGRAHV